jgi:transposase InsO family protein
MRYQFMYDHRGIHLVRRMCRVLGVSASGYYAWLNRPESNRARENRRLVVEIKAIHKENRGVYGSPRIHADLMDRKTHVSENRVARLMRENGIAAKQKKKYKATTCKSRRENVPVTALYEGGLGGLKMYHWYPIHRLEKDDLRRGEGCTAWSYTDEFVERVWLTV